MHLSVVTQGKKEIPTLSELEQIREDNIKRNNDMLQALGFNTAPTAQREKKGNQLHVSYYIAFFIF